MKLDLDALRALIATHADTPGGLMPALHAVQAAIGHVPPEVVPLLADTFTRIVRGDSIMSLFAE